ncbi:alpha-2-macroglobulin family protein [Changchengzhania lutea]|uniref:alpha-2-macroglobulin family protein n=1 Tax=Changchengzhania lutea TaxID=2049305 RepID=UPI00115E5DA7|nr:MG2 domain-containing protein [Changchengzhania lutea]
MKNLLTFLVIILTTHFSLAQSTDYNSYWDAIEKHEGQGLPKSALEIVTKIDSLAKQENNKEQFIKALIYKSKFALILEEDAQLSIINDFKTEIEQSNFPTKNLLENLLANLYWQYFNQNRYRFYNRTQTVTKVDIQDFRTWDLQTLFDTIHVHFQNSLKSGLMLQQESLENYSLLLNEQKGSKIYRPTLFDFLSHNALTFYKTNETSITKPEYKFLIDNATFLGDAQKFSTLKITSKDSTSLQLNALKIYQDLIAFHVKDSTPYALADVNIERLKFVNKHATFNNKQDLFLEAFTTESKKLKDHEVSGLYLFEIANIFYSQSTEYQPKTKPNHQWKAKEALAICEDVISNYPKSKGADKCLVLKQRITQNDLQLITEDFLPIDKDARLLVRYKNLNKLDFKIYKLSRSQLERLNKIYRKNEQLAYIKTLKESNQWGTTLPNEDDYQTHSTEILVPKLKNGHYVVFASLENDADTFAFSTIQVTNLALVEKESTDHKIFQVINRNHGTPITNAQVELNYYVNGSRNKRIGVFSTNSLGEFKIEKSKSYHRNMVAKVEHNSDLAYFGDYYLNRHYKEKIDKFRYKSFVFTDRSIYRPGQTVHFKGIAMKTDDGKSEVLANQEVYAILYNVNGEEVKELLLKTNDFGSVSGTFILPNNGLNGQYHIEFDSESGNIDMESFAYFSVEDYKRPKFETQFKPVTKTFKINDSITVQGEALAYAGSSITDAKVTYRVRRNVRYPVWYYWYRPYFNSEAQEITYGETTTDASGNFDIIFKAIPDLSVDKSSLPIFNYEITADVTDLNGETRSATTIVNVGYHALIATMSLDANLDKNNKDHSIKIETKNLNGEFVPAKGLIKVYKLEAPQSVLRPRPWAAPDYTMISKKDFKNLFPHEAYRDEHLPENWKKGEKVFEKSFNTSESKDLALGKIKNWESGKYLITLESKDKFGQLVKDEIKTTLYSHENKTVADNQLFQITPNKESYAVGENAIITLGSAAKNLNVTVTVEKNRKIIKTEIVQLNNNKKTLSIPITKEDLGGFSVTYSYAVFNSFQSGVLNITVPYPKTDLEIETKTFRDKLQPGTDETWSFKIKGPQGEKVSAELLACMYDASLDQFKAHTWNFNPIQNRIYDPFTYSNGNRSFGTSYFKVYNTRRSLNYPAQSYDQFNWFGFSFGRTRLQFRNESMMVKSMSSRASGIDIVDDQVEIEESSMMAPSDASLNEVIVTGYGDKESDGANNVLVDGAATTAMDFSNIKIRKNLQETAFFFPHLKTDDAGNISFSFTTPEALTQWKLQLLAHTKTLESSTKTLTAVTQKELMVIPNTPRFLREGDVITISTKISNLTESALSGQTVLQLFDATTGQSIDVQLSNSNNNKAFKVNAKGNTQISWDLSIPKGVQAVQYKIIAKSGDFSDGEQNAMPVLTNRMLVTETLPMWIRSNQTKTFTLDKLKNVNSNSLSHHKLTLEMTSNPAWYAVQALPYLMEYPYACNEQTFSRYYANALASHIANSNPRIQEVFKQWASQDALLSNLEKNPELKSILIQETPWLRDAQSETEQKKRIGLLFDLNTMNNELQSTIRKLKANQMNSGAWAWFNGGRENRYITQHIITGFGHLKHLNVPMNSDSEMIESAIKYLDAEFVKTYKDIRKYNDTVDLDKDHLSYIQLHYLYMRSFFSDIKKSKEVENIIEYYQTQIQKYWLKRSLYSKGLMALVSHRNDDETTASKILKSLKETSITSEELGMYWKSNTNSWHWYQAPIETQSLLIEAFAEIENDTKTIDELKIWLLKNKQTNRWKTTKATTEAVYALLLQGSDWLSVTDMVDVVIGGLQIEPSKLEAVKVEAGTGYYKTSWSSSDIKPEMAEVTLAKKGNGIAWGALYWQYFEDLDKITSAETPLALKKKLFLKTNTDTGEQISEITKDTALKVGDLIRVRIELRSDRAMEFIHMKDMRAAGLEPINVLSKYKWQDGLGYYESTKDAATNFFFDYLPKGVYVFEYDLRVNNAGNMSNGITTIQSMYAPEFSSHSEGIRLLVN